MGATGRDPGPEIPVLTITDLGMVRNVTQMERMGDRLYADLFRLSGNGTLIGAIREAMTTHGFTRTVVLQLDPAWTTDWMTPDARERLRRYGISPPGRNSCRPICRQKYVARAAPASIHTYQ